MYQRPFPRQAAAQQGLPAVRRQFRQERVQMLCRHVAAVVAVQPAEPVQRIQRQASGEDVAVFARDRRQGGDERRRLRL